MNEFIRRHEGSIIGTLEGFDRVQFRGTARMLANAGGLKKWLWMSGVLFKDFGEFARRVTERIKRGAIEVAERSGRPVVYLASAGADKERVAREIAERDGITRGLVCAITCVEHCQGFDVRRNAEAKKLELVCRVRQCLHVYHYHNHPVLGWMNARLQTWFPFTMKVCINGRRWLGRQMDKAGLGYVQRENCFVALARPERAQRLMDRQLTTDWPELLNGIARGLSPAHRTVFARCPVVYYWSADQTEWATDVMFRSAEDLAPLYPRLTSHAMVSLGSADVMRFLGRKVGAEVKGTFAGEVVSDLRRRPEGIRVKHRLNANSVKMYDKQGSVLRVETTINHARDIKVYRRPEGKSRAKKSWQKMRKGVADLHRRAQVSGRANGRYLQALAAADTDRTLADLTAPICRRTTENGRSVRALNPLDGGDARLLQGVARAEFVVTGFRNADLRGLLYQGPAADDAEARRRSAAVTRQLRLLRAHGLIHKIPGTHRYQLTTQGRTITSAVLAARAATPASLTRAA